MQEAVSASSDFLPVLLAALAGMALGALVALILRRGTEKAQEAALRLAGEHAIRLEAEKDALLRQITQQKENDETLLARLENLSHKIIGEHNEKFKAQSSESLGQILSPLREKIGEFEKKMESSFTEQVREQTSLKEQIRHVVDINRAMTQQAENLASAIKGDSKVQGDWGEILLENLLESSGLRKGEDYIAQGAGLGLAHAETGARQKPDVVVNLPEGKHVIIDSKLSLRDYERFFSEQDEVARAASLKQFLVAVRERVKELEQRRYQDTDKLGTPDMVLMFMPIEGAFMLALQQDPELHSFAWARNVAIVCPSTLFATLKTIASLWRLVRMNQNAQTIAAEGGALYDKVEGFVRDMQALGKQMKTAGDTYEAAMNKLSLGRGNILGRTEKLKKLGATTSKSLPAELLEIGAFMDEDDPAALPGADGPSEKKRA
jgi:DNA recombination protein RmuC